MTGKRSGITPTQLGKAFARRGAANLALGELLDAHHDLRSSAILLPDDAAVMRDTAALQQ